MAETEIQHSTGSFRKQLLVAVLVAACGFSATYSAESSAADVYLRTTTAITNLSNTGAPVTIRQVTIPAGTWVVTAKANPVNFGAADYVRCRIMVGNAQKDAAATLVGNAAPGPTGETGPSVAAIALQTAITTTTSKVFKLDCLHDFPTAGMYVDPGASILVVRAVGPLG
jgi:hypothetical protein